jgi:hypothetical protein
MYEIFTFRYNKTIMNNTENLNKNKMENTGLANKAENDRKLTMIFDKSEGLGMFLDGVKLLITGMYSLITTGDISTYDVKPNKRKIS